MLLAIRERAMGLLGWILLALIFISFAFFGLNWYFQSDARAYAVSVNDEEIPLSELQRAYQVLRNRMRDMMGESYNPALIDEDLLKKNALDQLINEELLLQEAEQEGFSISNQLVAAQINSVNAFREDGSFSRERYERALRQQGMSPAEFEWRLARELMTQQLRSGIIQTAAATVGETEHAYQLQQQQRRFKHLLITIAKYEADVEVSEQEIERYYEAHSEQFMSPERIRVQYLDLQAANIATATTVDEQALRTLYDSQSGRFVTPEERRARHILIGTSPDAGDDAIGQARKKAEDILSRLEQGESFDTLAREASDDPGSAANGGDLGFFGKDIMTPEFEAAVFSLEKGARSGIVRSPFGFHIIEVTDIKPELITPFDQVRDELSEELLTEERHDLFYNQMETLSNMTFENPDDLQPAAYALDLEVMTSDWLTRAGGAGIGQYPELVNVAFSEDVLQRGNNSEAVELDEERVVVLRIDEHEEPSTRPLAAVRDEIIKRIRQEKARARVEKKGNELLSSLQAGSPIEEIADAQGLELQSSGLVTRRSDQPEQAIIRQAFLLPSPENSKPSAGGTMLASGDYLLISLEEVKDGDLAELTAEEKAGIQKELGRIQGANEMTAVLDVLRSRAVIINPDKAN